QDKDFGCVIGRGWPKKAYPSLLPSQNHYLKSYSFEKYILNFGAHDTEKWHLAHAITPFRSSHFPYIPKSSQINLSSIKQST
ncbi:MAG: hypothetical protein WA151_07520, partial [Desulfatirhabdiaceae bacterium]